ncbi:hypothetical protein FMEAI12_3850009 [Parafrankia sp. Ea1.12]|nr:hypothetical protein FMEAI12_3850009 [Parafrankia sp. Ea1.12]
MSHCHRRRHLRLAISIRAAHELSHRDLAGVRRPGPHGHEEMDSTLPDLARARGLRHHRLRRDPRSNAGTACREA